jgi:hypothetical protein
MPLGRLLWLVRPIGLPGPPLPPADRGQASTHPSGAALRGDLAVEEPAVYLRRWAAWLSLPSTEVLMRHDHVILQEDGSWSPPGPCSHAGLRPRTPIDPNSCDQDMNSYGSIVEMAMIRQ